MKEMKTSLLIVAVLMSSVVSAWGAPPSPYISYSKVTTLIPGAYTFRFSLWNVQTGGSEAANRFWWEEKEIQLTTSTLTTYLGSTNDPLKRSGWLGVLDFSIQFFVQTEVWNTATTAFDPVGGRTRLSVVPYAMQSVSSQDGGVTSVTGGNGLTSPGTTGDVVLNVGPGAGIAVTASTVSIATGGVTGAMLATGAVGTGKIASGAVTTAALADGAVTGAKIAALGVATGNLAGGAVTTAKIADGAVILSKISAAGATANQVLGFNGTMLGWQSPASGALSLPFSATADVAGDAFSVTNTNSDFPAAIVGSSTGTSGVGVMGAAFGGEGGIGIYGISPGGVGVYGSSTTGYAGYFNGKTLFGGKLDVVGQDALHLVGGQPFLTLLDDAAGYARSCIQGVGGDLNLFTESYMTGANPYSFLKVANNGNVGIGSHAPLGKLEVVGQDALRLIGWQPFLTLYDENAGYAGSRIQSAGGEMLLVPESYLNGSDYNAYVKLANSGTLSVKTLTIRGGADLAEPFDVRNHEKIIPGMLLTIDPDNPGKLRMSKTAYDRSVAGVASGAGGINPGMTMRQEGSAAQGEIPVALSGRVYCMADASKGTIRPGDLLTTSDVPGHAMRVTDYTKAQGAVIGKAMTGLEKETGLVLVLVTLQ